VQTFQFASRLKIIPSFLGVVIMTDIRRPQPKKAKQSGEAATPQNAVNHVVAANPTLKQAWERYLWSHLLRKGRSKKTIKGYRDHVERVFIGWLDTPLRELAADPAAVAEKHDDITRENGPYMANASIRTLRAIYNHARKTNKSLPFDNPADAIDWNNEERRATGMGPDDLKEWFIELAALDNPVRREFHLFTLLSGSRPTALQEIRLGYIDFRLRLLRIPSPKGGSKRAFDIALSRQMMLCLCRAIRFGRVLYPSQSQDWVFPAHSASGHIAEIREDRDTLSKWGNDLRQSFRTMAVPARVSDFDAKLLMNHAILGVNEGYITRYKLLKNHLRREQQAISTSVFAALGTLLTADQRLQGWLGFGAARRACNELRSKQPGTIEPSNGKTDALMREQPVGATARAYRIEL
jgi:site-specific recombinase XerD